MKYEIEFDNNTVDNVFINLYHAFTRSENNFEDKDLMRNIVNTVSFEGESKMLRLFGAETEVGTYDDNGFLRIGYARINEHEFIKNGVINFNKLKDALWEIAHRKKENDE